MDELAERQWRPRRSSARRCVLVSSVRMDELAERQWRQIEPGHMGEFQAARPKERVSRKAMETGRCGPV